MWHLTWIHLDDDTEWTIKTVHYLILLFKAWIKCTSPSVTASGILGSTVLDRIDIWVGLTLNRLKAGGWSRNTVDRQSCMVSFIAFSCASCKKRKSHHNVSLWLWPPFIWLDSPCPPNLHSFPTQMRYKFSNAIA